MSPFECSRLEKFSTCELADAMLKLGQGPWGGYIADIEQWSPSHCQGNTRIVGPAFTVKMVEKSDTISPTPEVHFVDEAPKGSIVVISAPSHVKNAVWGGLMSARAKYKECKGVVIDGRVRDLNEHRDMNFPVFARSHSILPQNAFVRPSEIQVPLQLGEIKIEPSDIIVADVDGVICIPSGLVEQVIENCEKYVAIDQQCMEALKEGYGVKETFKKYRGN